MNCHNCGELLENTYICPNCGQVSEVAKKIIYSSNWHYNQGLEKAKVRDLSGAISSLNQALKYNKRNTNARNLLGLIYYQMGEIVSALSEWVISVHFQQKKNIAAKYIQAIQDNPAKLRQANKVIQKYNLALSYLEEKNADMAIIELKRVVNLSPTYVKAYQLLALLYMQRKQYAAARRVLSRAVKVDRNNMTTLNYMKEVNRLRGKRAKSNDDQKDEAMQINDPNPIVIEERSGRGYDYSTGFLSFINVLIGIIVGGAVVWLLIVPSITKVKANEYNQAVVDYSGQISERNSTIDTLNKQIESLQAQVADYQSTYGEAVNDAGASVSKLMEAASSYLVQDIRNAGLQLAEVDPAALTDSHAKRVYSIVREGTKATVVDSLLSSATEAFNSGNYVEAIAGMTRVLRMDRTYSTAVYYMGRAYEELGDTGNAAGYYKRLIESYASSEWLEDATGRLAALGDTSSIQAVQIVGEDAPETEAPQTSETTENQVNDGDDSSYDGNDDYDDENNDDYYDE